MKKILAMVVSTAFVGALAASPARATNGMDMIGYGARSIGMGGADVAVDSDAAAVSGNPAVVSGLAPSSANIGFTALMPDLTYKDPMQTVNGKKEQFYMPSLGYVHAKGPWSFGLGAYAQGGMGVHFAGVRPGPGAPGDLLMSEVGYLRINPLLAYKVSDDLSLGATVMIGYAKFKFSQFPDSGGMAVQGLTSWGYAGKIGAQYRVGDQVRLGATYTTQAKVDLGGGTATMGGGDLDAKLEDFTWPQEAEFGVAFLPIKGLTVAADVKWINWADTIRQPNLVLTGGPTVPFPMAWKDQWVWAIGAEYAVNATHTVRCGFNLANDPVPSENLNPLFPAIPTTHLTLGYGLSLGKWGIDLAYEHAFEKTQTNPNNGLTIVHSQNTVSLGATYRY